MARVNLRAAFMSGLGSPVAAQQVFTDRVDEISAFFTALESHEAELRSRGISPVVDRTVGRHNVLSYYGVGGIGKTTLSQELERRFVADAEATNRTDMTSIRVDLAEEGATDIEGLLLRLRAGLGSLGDRWVAFDLALSCYWARAHPGEPLQEFVDTSPMIRRAARKVRLGEQIGATVETFMPTDLLGFPGIARAGMAVYRSVRDRVRERRLLADCDLFAELIEADPDYETLSYFPYLLAWDLERLPRHRGQRPVTCVFLDTFEALVDHVDRQAESFLQRCIYLMPNVLFVVTGRNRLDWADRPVGSGLDFTGEDRWPNLHFSNDTREPRQHLVGYLSDSDAESYLSAALTKEDQPAIPVEIRRRIIAGAQGLPLYLDLSVSHFVEMLARGDEPTLDDFGGSFVAVATRTIRDLPQEERDLVRTASLLDRFDAGLLRAGQPACSDGRVARFLQRSFLMQDDAYDLPSTLHLALRMAIGDADATMPDGWSDVDRQQVAQRLLDHLGQRIGDDADRFTVTQALETGLKLANAQCVFDPWLVDATERLIEAGQWSIVGGWVPVDEPATPELQAINAAIKGVVLRRDGDPRGSVAVLDEAAGGLPSDSETGQLVRVHLAHALRNTGDYTRAAGLYDELLDSDFDHVARYWLCDHDFLNGRFRTALDQLESWQGRNAADEGERLRLVGHIARVNARFDDAASAYGRAIDLANTEGLAAAEAKALVNLAQTRCWTAGSADLVEMATRARELLDLVPNPVELVKLRSAEATAATMAGDHDGALAAIDDTRRLADEIGYTGGHNLADVAAILLAARAGDDPAGASMVLGDLAARTDSSGGNFYWVPVAAAWIGRGGDYDYHWQGIDWLDGEDSLRRWAEVAAT